VAYCRSQVVCHRSDVRVGQGRRGGRSFGWGPGDLGDGPGAGCGRPSYFATDDPTTSEVPRGSDGPPSGQTASSSTGVKVAEYGGERCVDGHKPVACRNTPRCGTGLAGLSLKIQDGADGVPVLSRVQFAGGKSAESVLPKEPPYPLVGPPFDWKATDCTARGGRRGDVGFPRLPLRTAHHKG